MTEVTIGFGGCVPKLRDQEVGLLIPKNRIEGFEQDAEAITRLYIRGLLPEAQTEKARKRLIKAIIKSIEKGK
jgi:hypothetical protein